MFNSFLRKRRQSAFFFAFLIFIASLPVYSASKWVPIGSGDITTIIPLPEINIDSSTPYSSGESVYINVGNVGATGAYYYRSIDQLTGALGAWQCKTANQVASADNRIEIAALPTVGQYKYQVAACMSGSSCDTAAYASGALACSETALTTQVDVANVSGTRNVTASSTVRDNTSLTSTEFKVNEMGAATYTVAIDVPAGTAGVQPSVALSYSSQGGDGQLGRGWSISAGSGISRCPKSKAYDGVQGGVSFSASDRLCLNGQRLILKKSDRALLHSSGQSDVFDALNNSISGYADSDAAYWAQNAVYVSATDSFMIVKPHYVSGQLKAFTLENQAGEIHYFGDHRGASDATAMNKLKYNSVNSIPHNNLVTNGGQSDALLVHKDNVSLARAWLLKVIQDVKRNYIVYEYDTLKDSGENYLSRIKYTGNLAQSLAPYAQIEFSYKDNKKKSAGWYMGTPVSNTRLLDYVRVTVDGHEHRKYQLNYFESEFTEEKNYLESIIESVDGQTLKPLNFSWKKSAPVTSNAEKRCYYDRDAKANVCEQIPYTDPFKPFLSTANQTINVPNHHLARFFDFNGDGFSDVVYPENGWKVKFGPSFHSATTISSNRSLDDKAEHSQVLDYNGDGVQDLLVAQNSESNWYALTAKAEKKIRETCLNQDDRVLDNEYEECFEYEYNTRVHSLGVRAHGLAGGVQVMDIDGDADLDLVYSRVATTVHFYENLGNGRFSAEKVLAYVPVDLGSQSPIEYEDGVTIRSSIFMGTNKYDKSAGFSNAAFFDVDGDGKTELLVGRKTTITDCSDDNNLPHSQNAIQANRALSSNRQRCPDSFDYDWYLFSAKDWSKPVTQFSGQAFNSPKVVDLNGDGLSDVLWRSGGRLYYRLSNGITLLSRQPALRPNGTVISVSDEQDDYTYYMDVNADGRTDILLANGFNNGWSTYFTKPVIGAPEKVTFELRNSNSFIKDSQQQFADVNGDAKLDLIESKDGKWQVRYGRGANQLWDVINRFTNGYGVSTHVSYSNITASYDNFVNDVVSTYIDKESSQAFNSDGELHQDYVSPKAGVYVVSRVDSDVTDHSVLSVIYQYGGLLMHKNGHGNLGFERLRTIDPQTCGTTTSRQRVEIDTDEQAKPVIIYREVAHTDYNNCVTTETVYHQLPPYTGMPKSTTQSLGIGTDAQLMSEARNVWTHQKSANGALQVYLKTSSEQAFTLSHDLSQSQQLSSTLTENVQNTRGLSTQSTITVSDSLINGDKHFTETLNEYGSSDYDQFFARLSRSTVTKYQILNGVKAPVADASSNDIVRTASFTYNTEGMLETEQTALGTTTHAYDGFGNKISTSYAALDATHSNQTRIKSSQYDSRGRLVISQTINNDSRYTTTTEYSGSAGQAGSSPKGRITRIKVTSPNGATREQDFDRFGQQIESRSQAAYSMPTLLERSYTSFCNSSNPCEVAGAYLRQISVASGAPEKHVYLDKFGREVQSKVERATGFGGGWLVKATTYNMDGKPDTSSEAGINGPSSALTTYHYNRLGQPYLVEHPNGQSGQEYHHNATLLISYKDGVVASKKRETKNYLGQLVKVEELNAENAVLTTINNQYNANNDLLKAVVNGRTQVINQVDSQGRKVSMSDADKGFWRYYFNGHGELYKQTNSSQQHTLFQFDSMGRKTARLDNDGLTCWQYSSTLAGKLQQVSYKKGAFSAFSQCQNLTQPDYQDVFSYGSNLQVKATRTLIEGETFHTGLHYDEFNRVKYTEYPAKGFAVEHRYNEFSQPTQLVNARTGEVYRENQAMDARGNITQVHYGNNVTENKYYDSYTGYINTINISGAHISVSQGYDFDDLGNLVKRSHRYGSGSSHNFCERFDYDSLNRLNSTRTYVSNSACSGHYLSEQVSYDSFGNILQKGNSGTYQYYAGTNRLKQVGARQFSYDPRGNVTADGQRTFKYTAFDKPYEISKAGARSVMAYDHNRSLYKRVDNSGSGPITTLYVKGLYERVLSHSDTEHKFYVGNVVVSEKESGTHNTLYLHQDHLGSTTSITNQQGRIVQQLRYDAWGKQFRFNTDSSVIGSMVQASPAESKGYTGHKMLTELDIIHMGGRIYDPTLGRFMQADPFIQAPSNSQNYNRYSYVLNNPLRYTDPSGYNFLEKAFRPTKKLIRGFMKMIGKDASQYLIKIGCQMAGAWAPVCVAVGNYDLARAFGADKSGALRSGAAAGIQSYVGSNYGPLESGLTGGIIARANGGNFGRGFSSSYLQSALMPAGTINPYLNVIIDAIIGGTVSHISGDKFKNGAASGAFNSILRQDWRGNNRDRGPKQRIKDPEKRKRISESNIENLDKAIQLVNEEYGDLLEGYELVFDDLGNADGQAPHGTNKIVLSTDISQGYLYYDTGDLVDLLIHEGLHHRIYNIMGAREYFFRNSVSFGSIHDDIYSMATQAKNYITAVPFTKGTIYTRPDLSVEALSRRYGDYF